MNIATNNGMGIKPQNINLPASNGMGIKNQGGLNLTSNKGMGLHTDNNYFKFNEYERKRE